MKKFTKCSLMALLFTMIFAGCQVFTTSFSPTEDSGIQISKITLSQTQAVILSGSRDSTTQVITASAYPSFAQDSTVYWESSNENIVALSATTGSSVTLILKGEGNAIVTAKNSSGTVSSSVEVQCSFEKTPPLAVSAVTTTPHGNNVFFKWTDPTDYDKDLNRIEIVSNTGEKATVAAGVQYGWVKNLNPSTDYTFTLTAYDANSNASESVSVSARTLDVVTEFTATEVSEPIITDKTATTFNLKWSAKQILAAEEKWNHIDISVADNPNLNSTIFYTDSEIFIPFTNLTQNTNYEVTITVYNDDFDILSLTKTITTDSYLARLVRDESVTESVSGYIAVKLEDVSSAVSYSTIDYIITAANGSSVTNIENQASSKTTAKWSDLSLDVDYTITARFKDSSSNVVGTSSSATLQATKVLWHLLSGYSSGRYVCRNICSDVPDGYTVGAITSGISTQEYWIVHKSLTGTENYYSLESTDANGTSTGYYMYLDTTKRVQDTGTNLWTENSSYTNKVQVARLSDSLITATRKDASFKIDTSTIRTGTGWYRLYDENLGYYIVHASLVFGGVAASTSEDTAGCAAIYIETSYIN